MCAPALGCGLPLSSASILSGWKVNCAAFIVSRENIFSLTVRFFLDINCLIETVRAAPILARRYDALMTGNENH
jgi:hypothetical protein